MAALTLKWQERGGGGQSPYLWSSKERVQPGFLNFIKIPQFVQKLWRIYLSILAFFIDFRQFSAFFDISLSRAK